jgi:hypothetical protein
MCDTVDELNSNMKTRFQTFENAIYSRFDTLEKALISHAEQAPAALSPMLNEIREAIKKVEVSTGGMGDRMTVLERWQSEVKGASIAVKSIWAIFSFMFVLGVIALFQMHDAINRLPQTVRDEVEKQMTTLDTRLK